MDEINPEYKSYQVAPPDADQGQGSTTPLLEDICNGDTSPVAITMEGRRRCEAIITDYLDELPSQTESEKYEHKYEQEIQDCGLNWLHTDYFEFHTNTEKDLENWKKGFSFELQSIKKR